MFKLRYFNRPKLIALFLLFSSISIGYFSGLFFYLFESKFETDFRYPLVVDDFRLLVENLKINRTLKTVLKPINDYNFEYHLNPIEKCSINHSSDYPIKLLVIIKSAACNVMSRIVIRQSWGLETRFSDVTIRRVFMLGQCSDPHQCQDLSVPQQSSRLSLSNRSKDFLSKLSFKTKAINCQTILDFESEWFNDIVQADFIDSYYNNIKKTMASLQWTFKYCSNIPNLLFVDDDYYVSIKNLLKFIDNFVQLAVEHDDSDGEDENDRFLLSKAMGIKNRPFEGRFYGGFVFPNSRPLRLVTSKWFVSLEEYPYDRYPPYVTGGCFLLNNSTMIDLYHASRQTKPFKFDDVFLGILAYKMDINLIEMNELMHFYKLKYEPEIYRKIIGSHGYRDFEQLWSVWSEQKRLGFA